VASPSEHRRFCEAAVGGEDHGAFLVSCIDEPEEQIAAAGHDWRVTDFVDDKEVRVMGAGV
jgi:hypothetical protein